MHLDESLARPGRKQANMSVRMAWISFDASLAGEKKKLDDSARPWHASEVVSFLIGLRIYQHPGITAACSTDMYVCSTAITQKWLLQDISLWNATKLPSIVYQSAANSSHRASTNTDYHVSYAIDHFQHARHLILPLLSHTVCAHLCVGFAGLDLS